MNRYQAISALAGSGKTYQLTLRFLALLSYGVRPESILAITFTRKAAGEIFDRILRRIAKAIVEKSKLETLQKELRQIRQESGFTLTREILQTWLRAIIQAIPYLRIGTIDSLFVSVVRAFAFELGIPPQCEILEDGAERIAQQEVLEALLGEPTTDKKLEADLRNIFEDLTQSETKTYWEQLLETIDEAHELFWEHSSPELWGKPKRIWSEVPPWWRSETEAVGRDDPGSLLQRLKNDLCPGAENESFKEAWDKAVEQLYDGTSEPNTPAKKLLERLEDVKSGHPLDVIFHKKPYSLRSETVDALRRVIAQTISKEVERMRGKTKGTYNLIEHYERTYHARVRAKGRLSFADVQHILAGASNELKRDIDYRLDGKFDHWMIDEFQDTSAWQWKILENLADEILQTDSGNRSFFYVGDPKQAIYGWRGGDMTLFDHVLRKYHAIFPQKPAVLNCSWRSSQAILDVVNKVFLPSNLEKVLSRWPGVIARWKRHWVEHKAVEKNAKLPGRAELRIVKTKNGEKSEAAILRETYNLAQMLKNRGVRSIAILVRLNSFGNEAAEYLRNNGLTVSRDIRPKLRDNGTVSALLSLFHFADFPDDLFSFQHVVLSGLIRSVADVYNLSAQQLKKNKPDVRHTLAERVRADCSSRGIAHTLCKIVHAKQGTASSCDPFIATRLQQLIMAAIVFDRLRGGGPADFAAYAAEYRVTDPESASEIVVMTIHKAKGLEFDAVILPDLQGKDRALNTLRTGALAVFDCDEKEAKELRTTPGWIFPIPRAHWSKCDTTLARFRAIQEEKRVYEELCLLYVAMTRARHGLFMITPSKRSQSQTIYPATVLRDILVPEHQEGEECYILAEQGDWPPAEMPERQSHTHPPAAPVANSFKQVVKPRGDMQQRLIAITPSEAEVVGTAPTAVSLFDPQTQIALDRGTLVHACFEKIEWYLPGLESRISREWVSADATYSTELVDAVIQEVVACLRDPTIQNLLKKPSENAEVWREQAFEMAVENQWITGRIDRVVIEKDDSGKVRSACLVDFKTDRVFSPEALEQRVDIYRPQMLLYKKAVSRVTGLSLEHIRAYLIFTHARHCERS